MSRSGPEPTIPHSQQVIRSEMLLPHSPHFSSNQSVHGRMRTSVLQVTAADTTLQLPSRVANVSSGTVCSPFPTTAIRLVFSLTTPLLTVLLPHGPCFPKSMQDNAGQAWEMLLLHIPLGETQCTCTCETGMYSSTQIKLCPSTDCRRAISQICPWLSLEALQ